MRMRPLLLAALATACIDGAAAPAPGHSVLCQPLGSASRHEHLSQLLRELSAVRKFRLENWTREDPIVSLAGGSDVELVTALSGQVNLLVRYAASKDCPGQWRIDTIWILPGQPGAVAAKTAPATASAADAAAEKAAMDMYLHAHGLGAAAPASGPN